MKTRIALSFALCLLGLPTPVLANAGTPLMITGTYYLLFGNALIGVAEGALLARIFRLPYRKSIGLLVLANYFSAWVGCGFLRDAMVSHASLDLHSAWPFFWTMVAATYGMTLVFELPFVAVALRKKPRWLFKSLWGSIVIQTASYALIFGWYWMVSGTSLFTETEVVALSDMSLPEEVLVFYISAGDGDVYMKPLVGSGEEKVHELNSSGLDDRLLFQGSSEDEDHQELVVRVVNKQRGVEFVSLVKSFSADSVPAFDEVVAHLERDGNWFSFGPAARLGNAQESPWEISTGFWPLEGLRAERSGAEDSWIRVSYETPFGHWHARNAIHLPSDQVLFQLGTDQICVYDPETRQISLVAKGRGPTAVLKEDLSSERVSVE